jgi:hypothetical protein
MMRIKYNVRMSVRKKKFYLSAYKEHIGAKAAMLLTCIQEVCSSSFSHSTKYPVVFLSFSRELPG